MPANNPTKVMSGARFTPGPWMAEPMTGRGAWVKGESGEWAALSCGNTDAIAEANARLIAAAPDMYEALIAALPYIESELDNAAYKRGAVAKVVAQMNAIIAKAEGR